MLRTEWMESVVADIESILLPLQIIGSGSMTHNMKPAPHINEDLHQFVSDSLTILGDRPDLDVLEKCLSIAGLDTMATAHPRAEHLVPLFVALGAAGGDEKAPSPQVGWPPATSSFGLVIRLEMTNPLFFLTHILWYTLARSCFPSVAYWQRIGLWTTLPCTLFSLKMSNEVKEAAETRPRTHERRLSFLSLIETHNGASVTCVHFTVSVLSLPVCPCHPSSLECVCSCLFLSDLISYISSSRMDE